MEGYWMNDRSRRANVGATFEEENRETGGNAFRYTFNSIEEIDDFGLNVNRATFRTLDPELGRWWSVDPQATSLMGLSPYNSMGNSPLVNADPNGDLFWFMPHISFNGGFSAGITAGVGIFSASVGFSNQGIDASVGVGYGPLSVSYGTSGFSASVGAGLNSGGLSINLGSINYGANGFGLGGPSVGYGELYQFGEVSPGYTAEPGAEGDFQGGTDGTIRGNVGLYEDETNAYNVMVEQAQFMGVETAAWLTDEGVLLSPIATPDYINTEHSSFNGYYKTIVSGKRLLVEYEGRRIEIQGQVHTHPTSDGGPWYWTKHGQFVGKGGDRGFGQHFYDKHKMSLPIHTIGPNNVHRGVFSYKLGYPDLLGSTRGLLGGKYNLIKR